MMKNESAIMTLFMVLVLVFSSCTDESEQIEPATEPEPTPAPVTPPSTKNLIFSETVEGTTPFSKAHDWDVGEWDYALQFVTDIAYQGNKSARFEIQEDQELVATGKRSEITIVKGEDGDIKKDTWYSFAVYFPSIGYEFDDEREVINQWYQDGSPATSLRTEEDKIILETGNTEDSRKEYTLSGIVKNKWHTVVMHFIHSYGEDGLIEIWYDGQKKITVQGGNMYNDVLPKWKIGLYKSAFKYGTSDVTKRIIYFDNVKVGNATSTYDTMIP